MAYFIRGISGFGSGLVSVPLLALMLPLQFVVPFILVLDITASMVLGGRHRKHVDWAEIKPLIPGSIVGVILGVSLLVSLDQKTLLVTLGLFVIAFALRNLLNLHGNKLISRLWALPASILGGTISALFGTGSPPYVIYLTHRIRDKGVFRATTSLLFLMEGALRGVLFALSGLLFQEGLLIAFLLGLPVIVFGLWLGSKVHVGISAAQMARLIGGLLLFSGISLLWKALH